MCFFAECYTTKCKNCPYATNPKLKVANLCHPIDSCSPSPLPGEWALHQDAYLHCVRIMDDGIRLVLAAITIWMRFGKIQVPTPASWGSKMFSTCIVQCASFNIVSIILKSQCVKIAWDKSWFIKSKLYSFNFMVVLCTALPCDL
jgi:hypothetical protein